MTSSSAGDAKNLPAVIVHRLPQFKFSLNIQHLCRPLEPSDPSFAAESLTARALISVGPTPVTADTLNQYPSVEYVVATSAGVDHIDLNECRRRGIQVSGNGGAFSEDVADYAVALLLDVLRRVSSGDRFVRAGLWPVKGEFPLGSKLGGKRIGIIGLGSIGSLIAKRLEPFGCFIAYSSRRKKPHVPFPFYSSVHELATSSDVLIVCCSLTNETHHIINKDVMTALGKKGVIINVGRGSHIDEEELVQFLLRGDIGGAGLDVFENEPNVPKELFEMENVVLSPHRAVLTPESFAAVREVIVANLEAFFSGKPLVNPI